MADATAEALGKLDGRNPNQPNYPPNPWCDVTMYQEWAFGHNWIQRHAGADAGKAPGQTWWTPSDVDHDTVLAEILTKKYHGCTLLHMTAALFAILVEGHKPEDVRNALGLPTTPLDLYTPSLEQKPPNPAA
jgi:hypothetical protein